MAIVGTATLTGIVACQIDPLPPTILSVSQASNRNFDGTTTSVLAFGVVQNKLTGISPITQLKLYRGNTPNGPFTLLRDIEVISSFSVVNQLFDGVPEFGIERYYVATAVDQRGVESAHSNVVFYTASLAVLGLLPGSLSPAARGPYPVLGCDIYIDPTTREAVIGPNGDLLTVNGLEFLAQDLRLRILTDVGELPLHPTYGLSKSKVIGSGQAKPEVQAQIFRADIIDVLRAEPRVYKVLDVQISQADQFSWVIGFDVMAVNVEDVQRLNMIYPYFKAAA